MEDLKEELNKCLQRNVPFVFYRKPKSNIVKAIIQKDNSVSYFTDLSVSGFVFAPFDDRESSYFIPEEKSINNTYSIKYRKNDSPLREIGYFNTAERRNYIEVVQTAIDIINNSEIQKIVTSRKETVEPNKINIFNTLEKLLYFYQQAFVYVWFHPLTGLWMGATPEILLEVDDNKFKTMALAGTRSYEGTLQTNWGAKEIQEQQFVTDYIQLKLKGLEINISDPVTIRAGSLLHICSEIKGELTNSHELYSLIRTLHPTPAVCGIPKDNAKQFILNNENYDREYYTGFLGEIDSGTVTNLYVNLRCMKINNTSINIYIGGGITKDSIPEDEWKETCIKSAVMKRVL